MYTIAHDAEDHHRCFLADCCGHTVVIMFIRHEDSYRNKRVVIVGFGNTACDAAVDLSSACSQVTLCLRLIRCIVSYNYTHCHPACIR